jgi:hypothetical protein
MGTPATQLQTNFENRANVAIQAGQQIFHGGVNIHQSVLECILYLEPF